METESDKAHAQKMARAQEIHAMPKHKRRALFMVHAESRGFAPDSLQWQKDGGITAKSANDCGPGGPRRWLGYCTELAVAIAGQEMEGAAQ